MNGTPVAGGLDDDDSDTIEVEAEQSDPLDELTIMGLKFTWRPT